MHTHRPEIWLVTRELRLRVGPAGVLIGRAPSCDLRLDDKTASRHHALVHLSGSSAVLSALGRQEIAVNGALTRGGPLAHGDRVVLPGVELTVEITEGESEGDWFLQGENLPAVRVSRSPFSIGAGGDLAADGWPEEALTAELREGRLVVTGAVSWIRNGVDMTAGLSVCVEPGDELMLPDAVPLAVQRASEEAASTLVHDGLPDRVELEFLPRGGRLHLATGSQRRSVWIAERRFALLICLLDPPTPHRAGEVIPDEIVIQRIWPRQPHKSRVDLNVLVGRLRRDLEEANLSASSIARASGGGGTRFLLAEGATVAVR